MLTVDGVFTHVEKAIAIQTRCLLRDPLGNDYIPPTLPTAFDPEELAQTIREQAVIHLNKLREHPEWIDVHVWRWTMNWCRTLRRRAKEDAREPEFFHNYNEPPPVGFHYAVASEEWVADLDGAVDARAFSTRFPQIAKTITERERPLCQTPEGEAQAVLEFLGEDQRAGETGG